MLVELGVEVGDVVTRAQVVRMIEVEVLLKGGLACRIAVWDVLAQELGDDARGAGVDVLGAGRSRAAGEELVHIDGFALGTTFDETVSCIIVFVGLLVAVVEDRLDAVLLIPNDRSSCAVSVVGPTGLVAVGVIRIGPIPDVIGGVGPDAVKAGGVVLVGKVIAGLLLGTEVPEGWTMTCAWVFWVMLWMLS